MLGGDGAYRVVSVVETEAAYNAADFVAGEGREQLLDCQHIIGDLRPEVGDGTKDLVCLDGLPELGCNADCTTRLLSRARGTVVEMGLPSCLGSTGSPRWTFPVSAATKRIKRVQFYGHNAQVSDVLQRRGPTRPTYRPDGGHGGGWRESRAGEVVSTWPSRVGASAHNDLAGRCTSPANTAELRNPRLPRSRLCDRSRGRPSPRSCGGRDACVT